MSVRGFAFTANELLPDRDLDGHWPGDSRLEFAPVHPGQVAISFFPRAVLVRLSPVVPDSDEPFWLNHATFGEVYPTARASDWGRDGVCPVGVLLTPFDGACGRLWRPEVLPGRPDMSGDFHEVDALGQPRPPHHEPEAHDEDGQHDPPQEVHLLLTLLAVFPVEQEGDGDERVSEK